MSWWLALAVLAMLVVLLAAMPWKRPHPNHVFALEILERLAEKESEAACGAKGKSGLRESVSTDNDQAAMVVDAAPSKIKPTI